MTHPPGPHTLTVPRRFNGPPSSGNGGWSAGALADQRLGHASTVLLRQPPPLDVAMTVTVDDVWTTASHQDQPVLKARAATEPLTAVAPVDVATARMAEKGYRGAVAHPFATCFACGPAREDGLRIFPGAVTGPVTGPATGPVNGAPEGRVGATWTPSEVSVPVTWAALDCIGGWSSDLGERPLVLGTITARIDALPQVGVEHVVVGEMRGVDGRKTFTAASLYAGGQLVGTAEHVWFAIDPKDFA